MTARLTANLFDSPSISQGMLQTCPEGFRNKAKRIKKVALSRTVWTHKQRQGWQADLAASNALVIPEIDALDTKTGINKSVAGVLRLF